MSLGVNANPIIGINKPLWMRRKPIEETMNAHKMYGMTLCGQTGYRKRQETLPKI
ncbi:MAG: hypothetical protein F7B11_02840 [Caldisphaeraceae archaeon]|nr:hypothetical protein [Caldisphaeraceae archaeon]